MKRLSNHRSPARAEVRLRHSYPILSDGIVVVQGASGWDLAEVADRTAGTDRDDRIDSLIASCVCAPDGAPLSIDQVGMLSIGDFHLVLAALSRLTFGNSVELTQPCPATECGEPMGWPLNLKQLLESVEQATDPVTEVVIGERRHEIRPATVDDATAIRRDADPLRALLERCVEPPLDGVDDDALKVVEAAFDELDPLASTTFTMRCTSCGLLFRSELDLPAVVDELWRIDDRHRANDDHLLAIAYGWRPDDLAGLLPPARRRLADALLDRWDS